MGKDKLIHYGVATTATYGLCWASDNYWVGAGVTAYVSAVKELFDKRHPESHSAEWGDIVADAAGIVTGCLLYHLTRPFIRG